MKGFVELTLEVNTKVLIATSSISLVEDFGRNTTRVVMKEKVEKGGANLFMIANENYAAVRIKIGHAVAEL